MIRVVLWDYIGDAEKNVGKFLKPNVKIIRTLRPNDADQAEVIMRGDWDYVLIFEKDTRKIFEEILSTIRAMNVDTENIIFAQDTSAWLENPAAIYSLIDFDKGGLLYRWVNLLNQRKWHDYSTCTVEGISYVATSKDDYVISQMYLKGKNHAEDEMKTFHALAKKYYNVDDSAGYFLDLGANIGTTGIYFTKKIAPNLKLLAFEPDPENFKLLHANLILNDMINKAIAVNYGLGEYFDEKIMYRDLKNPGHNNVTEPKNDVPTEKIEIIPLDAYLDEMQIAAQEVKYIWIDTEGFEPQVLLGAKNLLRENPTPVFMEFNPTAWNKSGFFERMVDLLKAAGYTHWIHIPTFTGGNETLFPIDELLGCKDLSYNIGETGDIFLVRNF